MSVSFALFIFYFCSFPLVLTVQKDLYLWTISETKKVLKNTRLNFIHSAKSDANTTRFFYATYFIYLPWCRFFMDVYCSKNKFLKTFNFPPTFLKINYTTPSLQILYTLARIFLSQLKRLSKLCIYPYSQIFLQCTINEHVIDHKITIVFLRMS